MLAALLDKISEENSKEYSTITLIKHDNRARLHDARYVDDILSRINKKQSLLSVLSVSAFCTQSAVCGTAVCSLHIVYWPTVVIFDDNDSIFSQASFHALIIPVPIGLRFFKSVRTGHLRAQPLEIHVYNRNMSSHFTELFFFVSHYQFSVLRSPFPFYRSPLPVLVTSNWNFQSGFLDRIIKRSAGKNPSESSWQDLYWL